MTSVSWSISLTLVLLSFCFDAHSAPSDEIDLYNKNKTTEEAVQQNETDDSKTDRISITPPPRSDKKKKKTTSLYYPYKQSMSPRLGFVLDPDILEENGEIPVVLGLSYMLPRTHTPQVEFTFDLLTNSKAHFSGMLRRIFYEREAFRPYIKAGATVQLDASERLAAFSDWDNYLARASIGFEDAIKLPMSVRIEIEVAANTHDQMLIFNFGYSWGW